MDNENPIKKRRLNSQNSEDTLEAPTIVEQPKLNLSMTEMDIPQNTTYTYFYNMIRALEPKYSTCDFKTFFRLVIGDWKHYVGKGIVDYDFDKYLQYFYYYFQAHRYIYPDFTQYLISYTRKLNQTNNNSNNQTVEKLDPVNADLIRKILTNQNQKIKRYKTPRYMKVNKVTLYKYQERGLYWMANREQKKDEEEKENDPVYGGILADQMGLGKTVQMIALFLKNKPKSRQHKTLLICPVSVIEHWSKELSTKAKGQFNVLVYHGPGRHGASFNEYDVVITTYHTAMSEHDDDEEDKKKEISPLYRITWHRIVLDEADRICNRKTKLSKSCCALKAKNRWCITGTPIKNSPDDLYGLFKFIKYKPYDKFEEWKILVNKCGRKTNLIRKILGAVILCRTKSDEENGKKLVELPPRDIQLRKLKFPLIERMFYDALRSKSKAQFKIIMNNIEQNKYASILTLLLRCRQACDHPFLTKGAKKKEEEIIKNDSDEDEEVPDDQFKICCGICDKVLNEGLFTYCEHLFCSKCILEYIDKTQNEALLQMQSKNEMIDENKNYGFCYECSSVICVEELRSLDNSINFTNFNPGENQSMYYSCKMRVIQELINTIRLNDPTDKILIFSEFVCMLNYMESLFKDTKITYEIFIGKMNQKQRTEALNRFRNNKDITAMLISTGAGNVGINLAVANHVIVMDPCWNPAKEDQAIERVHRIGQKKNVYVYKLIIEDSVEENIVELQNKKRESAKLFLEGHKGKKMSQQELIKMLNF